MAEFPKAFLSGPTDAESIFGLLVPKLKAKGLDGVRMPFPAQPLDPARVSLRELSDCQAMVLFLRGKYGTPWKELSGKSITEHEFLEAIVRQLPLFCFLDTSTPREPDLEKFIETIRRTTQKTLVYEERNFSDNNVAADRIASLVADFRWVPPAFASFGEWENLLLAQYSRVTSAHVDRNSYPQRMGRDAEHSRFLEWLKDSTPEKNTAIIAGMPGFGKTLFAYHAVRDSLKSAMVSHPDILVIVPGAEFDLQSLREIVPDPKSTAPILLIIDDGDERRDVAALMAKLASSPHFGRMKVIWTCQEGSTESLYFKGYPLLSQTHSTEIHLKALDLPSLQDYRNKQKLRVDDTALVALMKMSSGIPLYLDLYLNRGYNLGTISSQADMEEHFLRERLGDVAGNADQLALLKILALLGSISLQHTFAKSLIALFGLPQDVSAIAQSLLTRGLIYKVGTRHRVTDRLIQDFILAKYWTVNPERDRLLPVLSDAGEMAPGILENLARAEWVRVKSGASDRPFEDIWASIEVTFSKSNDSAARARILGLLKDAAYFLPDLAMKLATATRERQVALLARAGSLPANELESASDLTYSLGHWPQHFETAIDILWDLGKRDGRSLNAHPSHGHRHLESLAKLKPGAPIQRYKILLDHIESWLKEGTGKSEAWLHSPIEILDTLLEWEWSRDYYYKGAFTLQRGEIPHTAELEGLRIRAVTILGDCIIGAYGPGAIGDALHKMRGQLPVYQHPGWGKVGEAAIAQLRRAKDHYLVQNRLAIPYMIFHQIDDLMEIFEKKEKIDKASEALRTEILKSLNQRFSKELQVLEATVSMRFGGSEAEDLKRAQEALVSLGAAGAQALLDTLQAELATVGVELKIGVLSSAMIDQWRPFSLELYKAMITNSTDPRLIGHAIALLWDCRIRAETDAEARGQYLALLQVFPELKPPDDRPDVAKQVKGYVRWFIQLLLGSKQIRLLPEEIALIKSWRDTPDISWSLIVKHVAGQNPELARDLILTSEPGSNRKAADEVCSALISSKAILAIFSETDWRQLLEKLEESSNLDDYWIEQTIAFASNRFPRAVAAFLLRRLKLQEERGGRFRDYQALPWGIGDRFAKSFSDSEPGVRNELIEEALSQIVAADRGGRYFLYEYANLIAGKFATYGADILLGKAKTSDPNQLEAIAGVVQHSYPNFVFDHSDVIEALLESASAIGPELLRSVGGSLFAGAGTRGYSRALGQASPAHLQLQALAQKLKRKFLPGTATYEFFSGLEKTAEADIKREELEDEEALDE